MISALCPHDILFQYYNPGFHHPQLLWSETVHQAHSSLAIAVMGHSCRNAIFQLCVERFLSHPGPTENSRVISLVPWCLCFEPGGEKKKSPQKTQGQSPLCHGICVLNQGKKKNHNKIFTVSHDLDYIPTPEMTGRSSDPKTCFLLITFILLPGKALFCWL